MLPIYINLFFSTLFIIVMDDVARISSGLHAVLSKIIGSDEEVYVRRTATNLRDDIIRMVSEWTNEQKIPCFSGSKAEGLRFKSSDEDWMYIYRIIKVAPSESYATIYDVNSTWVFVMENEMTKPGFTLLRLVDKHYETKNLVYRCGHIQHSALVHMLNGRYLPSKLWRETHVHPGHGHTVFLHGPCASGFIDGEEYDWAHCLKCDKWPENARSSIQRLHQRSWPSHNTIQDIVSDGVLFVPIGAKQSFFEDTEWRMSFSLAEKRLIHSMNHTQFLCYGLLKLFLKEAIDANDDVKGLLCSYFLKTALFWEITAAPNQWNPSSLLSFFWKCFCRLLQWVNSSYCPNFFIPENNMFQGKIEGDNRQKLLRSLRTLHREGYRCLIRCPSLMSYPCMSEVINGHGQIQYPIVCTCGVCVAMSIIIEREKSNPHLSTCFTVDKEITCLVLEQLMHTTNNSLESFLTRSWLHSTLTDVCMTKPSHKSYHKGCNKIHYSKFVQKLRVLNRCRRDPVCHCLYQAMVCYNVGKYTQTLRLVEMTKDVIFSQGIIYIERVGVKQYRDAGGADLPIETVIKKSFYYKLDNESIHDYYIERYCNGCRQLQCVNIPPAICLLFLQYLCYKKLGNQQKSDESLYEISLIIQYDDDNYLNANDLTAPWRVLGICQQMNGEYRAAFRSYVLSLRDDIGEDHTRLATYIRLGTLLANLF